MPKRNNKRKSPMKTEMIMWIRDYKNVKYSMDAPYNTIKKVFAEMGGDKWWEINKKGK
tara:strand:- start:232 stop:405 length:174 start_codon:yes stop_codon:yes gene_type:complete